MTAALDRFLRKPEVLALIGFSDTVLYREMAAGRFPRPVKIGRRAVAWSGRAVYGWMDEQIRRGEGRRGPGRPRKVRPELPVT